jgi:DNA-binding beta-propeller fold protein YncE
MGEHTDGVGFLPKSMALSADGTGAYVASRDELGIFDRDPEGGTLSFVDTIPGDEFEPRAVAIAGDDLRVYYGMEIFQRDPSTQRLTPLSSAAATAELLALAPRQGFVVAGDAFFDLLAFRLDELGPEPIELIPPLEDLGFGGGPTALALSPDERHLYVADFRGGLLTFAVSEPFPCTSIASSIWQQCDAPASPDP